MSSNSVFLGRFEKACELFENEQIDKAKEILQTCIDERRSLTEELLRKYLDSITDVKIKHYIIHMYIQNYDSFSR
ncbi:MAG: hypothetical protein GF411_15000 [Candidatus Lokiarchaeota archaeon]|nr:hypothetical protein [Candidatus Lokiarchaeota archaeon]